MSYSLRLFLLQIFFHLFGFPQQKGDVLFRAGHEGGKYVGRLLEFLKKAFVFLIAPTIAKADQLPMQDGQTIAQFLAKLFEVVGETADFRGIDNRLGHDLPF